MDLRPGGVLVVLILLASQMDFRVAKTAEPVAPSTDGWEEDAGSGTGSVADNATSGDATKVPAFDSPEVVTEAPPPVVSSLDTSDRRVQKLITRRFNQERRKAGAADMLKLKWDTEAQNLAQKIAKRCVFKQPEGDAERTQFLRTKDLPCGMNMARSTGPVRGWNGTIESWLKMGENFQFGVDQRARLSSLGTYTAIIWSKTHKVGCAATQCQDSGKWSSYTFYVCTFCPAGNITPEKILKPYLPGPRCSRCPDSCRNGLCTNPCPYANKYANCDSLLPSGCDGPIEFDDPSLTEQCKATCQCKDQGLLY
ncbi:hypothetical protein RvY_12747 [Ramazzottius varieornatus]|uniref:ShKT domain-containing protein n=1 Tax=Ramazzottius varieornatus TaxID=947166 RepID=A0A1D1VMU4_RAMVA|nr:hypothetical protein RvY_12747 [Ramazzottius varieornatus]